MKLKIALISATALGMLMATGAVYAGDNNTTALTMSGNNNTGTVVQNGSNNIAGQSGYGLNSSLAMHQDGSSNTLTITQTGNSNSVAYQSNYVIIPGAMAAEQEGSNNTATLSQTAPDGGNALGSFIQEGDYNSLNFTQNGTLGTGYVYNSVGAIYQGSATGADPRGHSIPAGVGGNSLTVTQTQVGNGFQTGNSIETIYQAGPNDTATITQYGTYNALVSLQQIGSGGYNTATVQEQGQGNRINTVTQDGSNNQATVKLLGDYNGADSASPRFDGGPYNPNGGGLARSPYGWAYLPNGFTVGSAAASVALVSADDVTQTGSYNVLTYTASGNSNAYGFVQNGTGNTTTASSYNDSNQVAVGMQGSYNTVNAYQSGGDNDIGVSIYGSYNNAGSPFTGTAATGHVWGLSGGDIFQENGSGNSAQLNVGTSLSDSDNNLFAALQYGSDNHATGSVTGSYNQAVVVQVGSNNSAAFTQSGSGNNAYVQQ